MKASEFYKKYGFPSYLAHLPREIKEINGEKYWIFDYECEQAKKMNLNSIQKLFYKVKVNKEA